MWRPRTAPPRQKTLQATLHWSHELLSEVERVVLQGRRADARTTLQAAFAQFTEGFDTADLKTAQQLIAALR